MTNQEDQNYFSFSQDVKYVAGNFLGALYDLRTGDVYSLDRNSRLIVEQLLNGVQYRTIPSILNYTIDIHEVDAFLADLLNFNVGCLTTSPNNQEFQDPDCLEKNSINKLWLELTPACNFRCMHCYADAGKESHNSNSSLGVEQWKNIISAAALYSPPWIQFTGGEVLLCGKKFIEELLLHAGSKGIQRIEVFTNGYLLDEEWADIFSANKASIAFSIYSHQAKTHDKITGVPGSHVALLKHLEMLKRKGIPLRPGFILMEENEHEETETLEWLQQSFGVDLLSPDIIRCTPDSRCAQGVHFSHNLWQRKLRTSACFTKVTGKTFSHHTTGHPCLLGSLCIHHNGEVYPCVMDRTRKLGDLGQSSLSEIIESEASNSVWNQSMDYVAECCDCEFRFACQDCRPEAAGIHALLSATELPDFSLKNPCCLYDPYTGVWGEPDPFLSRITQICRNRIKERKA